jgi:hypothetical protein
MDGDLYDEFGNYIGPELSDSDEVRIFHDLQEWYLLVYNMELFNYMHFEQNLWFLRVSL